MDCVDVRLYRGYEWVISSLRGAPYLLHACSVDLATEYGNIWKAVKIQGSVEMRMR